MTRLTHSPGGFIRSLQVTSARVFAFVEGRLDRPFFDRVLSRVCGADGPEYRVYAMKELPGATGGKQALINRFREFRKKGLLACTTFGKPMVCIFFADKDADDFTRSKLRSRHLLYSPTYDLEGHLFNDGDLTRALADSCGITADQARQLIPDPTAWLRKAAGDWRDWITLCLVSQAAAVNCGCTFDRVSQVNVDPLAGPDPAQVVAFKTKLAASIGITTQQLEARFQQAGRSVDKSIDDGQPLRYFKGKWLSHLVQRYLEARPRIPDILISGVGERMGATLVAQAAQHTTCRLSAAYSPAIIEVLAML
jgi:hypothetical protein